MNLCIAQQVSYASFFGSSAVILILSTVFTGCSWEWLLADFAAICLSLLRCVVLTPEK
jgi:hypothetical protein